MDLDQERVASATECTGLMPALPQNPVQAPDAAKLVRHSSRQAQAPRKKEMTGRGASAIMKNKGNAEGRRREWQAR